MDDTELLKLFWTEVGEYLDIMNQNVMALEMSVPDDDAGAFVERLRELNRLAHSMKGAARAVGVPTVETLGYHMEEVFEASLKRGLALTPEIADLIYDALDLVQTEANGDTVDPDMLTEVVAQLQRAVQENATLREDTPPDLPAGNGSPRQSDTFTAVPPEDNPTGTAPFIRSDDELARPPAANSTTNTPNGNDAHTNTPVEVPATPMDTPDAPVPPFVSQPPQATPQKRMTQTMLVRPPEDTVRVSVDKLDRLMQDSSELLVTRLQSEERKQHVEMLRRLHGRWAKEWRAVRASYIRLARKLQTEEKSEEMRDLLEFLETNQRYLADATREIGTLAGAVSNDTMRLSTLTDEIQDRVSSLRLVPFDTVLGTLHRTLRDSSRETGKEAYLDVMGSTTEIDKTVLEHLRDPIMHLIRNAVDHGIETPTEREAIGKPPAGWVYLNIETRGSEIIIMVGDDGRGIDAERIRARALAVGLITQSQAQAMSEDEALSLIFHPGLTTRDEVTPISGRGVGMDVVRDRAESLRGRVSVTSKLGAGTITTISVPVSLTRIRAVTLRVEEEYYAVPSLAVQRMERLQRDDVFTAEGRAVVHIGERTLPLVSLGDMLNVPLVGGNEQDDLLRVVVMDGAEQRQVAFAVDELLSEREMVLKPLGRELAGTRYVSGAALLGGGEIVLVLDANDLVRGATDSKLPLRTARPAPTRVEVPSQQLRVLIADDSITTRTLEKNILETAGCDVRVAIDGVQAWEMLAEYPFDVVISDVEMPRMDGLALTRRIKESAATKHIPVVLLTSLNKPQHREAGLDAGADAYLVKSRFDQEELLSTIQSVL